MAVAVIGLRRLTEAEIASYDHLPTPLANRVRVGTLPSLPIRYTGITLGSLVLVTTREPRDGTSALLAHELVHVRQWHELGAPRFATTYVRDFAVRLWRDRHWYRAYRDIPAEIEARAVSSAWAEARRRDVDRGL